MVKYGPRISKMVLKVKKWSKNLQLGVKWSQNVQYGLKWYAMVPNIPTWSKKI